MTTTGTDQRDLIVELVTNSSRFTRLASSLANDDRPRALVRALSLLEEYGELRTSEFARLDRCSQPSATALMKKLHALDLVERTPDAHDSRASLIAISDKGRTWLAESRAAIGDALAPRFAQLEPEQIARITEGLQELRDILKSTSDS
ncbi:MarR family winged helix-turn-helix transcriptional regulator [Antrihabitans cavernicola]|uniref:MarR family transcriptional regulator n=1 Tax=Antrihabitans cavernicola TaxID=2495913 RepID=A0A5A7S7U4_9NOCA|nr:MarR family transcriptional regulator [Spelaeibacter cavernicola]KAA0018963.1 MarR family transcriptional regulator [Spelaeibacter cavernicola]